MRLALVTIAWVAAFAAAAPLAAAVPGDPPVEPLTPSDGATVQAMPMPISGNPAVAVEFTCPVYTRWGEPPFSTVGDADDYGVDFGTAPALGTDSRLLGANRIDTGVVSFGDNDLPPDRCRRYLAYPKPGVVYWLPWRGCEGCAGGYETGPVRSLRITAGSNVRVTAKWPPRAFAGYPFNVEVDAAGVASGEEVQLQRRAGNEWRKLGSLLVTAEDARGPVALRAGRHQVRAVVRVGDEEIASTPKSLTVRRARRWKTSSRQVGRWRSASTGTLSFRITDRGRMFRDGKFSVSMVCPSLDPFGNPTSTTMLADAILTRTRIAPDGGFAYATALKGHAIYIYGQVKGRRASGYARLSLGTCAGGRNWTAKLAGR